jgi:large subunit ribosomal protein L33
MAAKKKNLVTLSCQQCNKINYYTRKSKGVKEKLSLKKFCKYCQKHTLHKEKK